MEESDSDESLVYAEENTITKAHREFGGHSKQEIRHGRKSHLHRRPHNLHVNERVYLKHDQRIILSDTEWKKMIAEVDKDSTGHCQFKKTSSTVIISSSDKAEAKRAKLRIISYLIRTPWKKEESVSADLKILVNFVKEQPRSCLGDDSKRFKTKMLTAGPAELKELFDKTGHEKIDFDRISNKNEDRMLMLKGLDSKEGKNFLKAFESKHDCLIIAYISGSFRLGESKTGQRGHDVSSSGSSDIASDSEEETKSILGHQMPQSETVYETEKKRTTCLQLGSTEVKLIRGEIVKQKADALVNIVSPSHSMKDSVVAKAFVECGGQQIIQDYEVARGSSNDTVVRTSSCGDLKCSAVFHVVLQKDKNVIKKVISKVITTILKECEDNDFTSVSFPPLGVGKMYRYPPEIVAERMLAELQSLLCTGNYGKINQITFVIFDEKTYTIFEKTFTSFEEREELPSKDLPEIGSETTYETLSRSEENIHRSQHRPQKSKRSETRCRKPRTQRSAHHFHGKEEVSSITVYAINEDTCVEIRNELGKQIKEEFVHEEKIEKRQKISEKTKQEIKDIIGRARIESVKERAIYVLKGQKRKVIQARAKISELLQPERGTSEFVKFMCDKEPEIPLYWTEYLQGASLESLLTDGTLSTCEKSEVEKDTFDTIVKMVNSTFDKSKIGMGRDAKGLDSISYSKLVVLKVERIENPYQYRKFTEHRRELFRRLLKYGKEMFPKIKELPHSSGQIMTCDIVDSSSLSKDLNPEVNEVLLFHGTNAANVDIICTTGFDQRLGSGKAMLGSGVYAAERSSKADQYTDDRTARTGGSGEQKKMFLIRMLLGNCFLCKDQNPKKYRRPPCTACFKDDCRDVEHRNDADKKFGVFDSVLADIGKLYREFVVYDSSLIYPEYLITYERL